MNVDCENVTGEYAAPSVITRPVHDALLRALGERDPAGGEAWRRREREAVRTVLVGPDYALVQLFARRPSV